MNYVKCEICGSDKLTFFAEKDNLVLQKCLSCGLIFTNPRPESKDCKKIYFSPEYFDSYFKNQNIHLNKRFKNRIAELKKFKKEGKLLDIGCGAGFFLDLATGAGYDVFGLEISPFAGEYARNNLGIDVFTGDISEYDKPPGFFDIITLWHVLEHSWRPKEFLEKTASLLKEDGILAIEIPNIGSPVSKIASKKWELLSPGEHLFYFTYNSLEKILKKVNLNIISRSTYLWTTPEMLWGRLFHPFSMVRFRKLPPFIQGDVMVIYAVKDKKAGKRN